MPLHRHSIWPNEPELAQGINFLQPLDKDFCCYGPRGPLRTKPCGIYRFGSLSFLKSSESGACIRWPRNVRSAARWYAFTLTRRAAGICWVTREPFMRGLSFSCITPRRRDVLGHANQKFFIHARTSVSVSDCPIPCSGSNKEQRGCRILIVGRLRELDKR